MRTWTSVHAFYHGDLDVLLRQAVRPLLDELRQASLIDGYFFLRYWEGGPHLRLRLSAPARPGHVRELALRRLRDYLAVSPSKDIPDLGRYPAEAARQAAAEGVVDYLRELMPNNTAREIAYRPEHDRYGHGEQLAAVERHFVESSRIALGLVAAGMSPGRRHTAAFSAILLSWNGAAVTAPHPDTDHEVRYQRRRANLHDLARRVAEIADGVSAMPTNGALTAWWRTVSTLPDRSIADLCTHLFCNRIGIGPGEERYLRYLAARTLTSEGVSP
jgi:hypothetical protein